MFFFFGSFVAEASPAQFWKLKSVPVFFDFLDTF